ncbi:cytochrome C biogenesis protein CcsA [Pseudidiomarina tainanensis]|uniref:Cytochrome C biogenesis protein CcsA n=1 Tax=Pseudidiomarina tainanensis TaxID=502365 RepID=A0ACD2HH75_9GAMM|nr:cytochrome-c peroxidase [Pseudidiomarina tainanensis]RZQ55908.1 cytochrome C biogenesis protein CcsA [Pseudidiomarina tainanensis]
MKALTASVIVFSTICLTATHAQAEVRNEPIKVIEPYVSESPEKVELGKQLFFDPRLSMSGIISCNTCHNLSYSGTDNLKTSIGHKWQAGPVNSPTVFNSSLQIAQFWDGRALDLKEQAAGPIAANVEMAMPHTLAVDVIQSIPGYRSQVEAVYGTNQVTLDHITDAIAEFEKTLVTPNAPFDRWLQGDDNAITEQQLAGYQLFKQAGCVACHYGEALGGKSFMKMGLVQPYESDSPSQGRYDVTGKEIDRFMFKVPTLRNVAITYPYFHDGAANTLEEATQIMGQLQLGRNFTKDELANLVAFMESLTGERPKISLPLLPPSGENTPRPNPFQ